MKTLLAGFAASALVVGVAGLQPAAAMPIQTLAAASEAGVVGPTEVQYRRYGHRRHYYPRYRYVAPYPYYSNPYPYRYYSPGPYIRLGPLGLGFGGW